MNFDDIKVSTQTYIVKSDIKTVSLQDCFNGLNVDNEKILKVSFKGSYKGEKVIAKRCKREKVYKNFLNCVTACVMMDKRINVKIFNNGVFQLTGCKSIDHVIDSMALFVGYFRDIGCCEFSNTDELTYYIVSVMRNIDFDIGYKIDRKSLGKYVSDTTQFYVPPMTSGYMGVKIKIPVNSYLSNVSVNKIVYDLNTSRIVNSDIVSYEDFYTTICPNHKKLTRDYFVSISVFQNGKVLLSGIDRGVQEVCYLWFVKILSDANERIRCERKTSLKTFRKPT